MNIGKKIGIGVVVLLVAIQFIHPKRNESKETLATDITNTPGVPQTVLSLLKRSCYDCHSNNTAYPWYANWQPTAWYLSHHVNDGKRALNFSDFGSYSKEQQIKKLKGISREVEKGGMPLSSYTLIHRYAVLNPTEKHSIIHWADSVRNAY